MSENLTIETNKALKDLFYEYTHLSLGGKEIVCPYWMNKLGKVVFGPGGGKGKPKEIIEFTKTEAENKKIDLGKLTADEIISFMKKNRIGIDCSGFVFWLLDALDLEKGGNGISDDIPGSQGKFIKTRASAKMLTNDEVSFSIEQAGQIQPGDMLRFRGGNHLAVVLSTVKENNQIKEIVYGHSSSNAYSEQSGVHEGKILIINPKLSLRQQKWEEKTNNNSSYAQNIWPNKGDGVKRLKIWQKQDLI